MTHTEPVIGWRAIGRIIAAILILLLIWKTLGILLLILVSAMFATALYPLVMKLHRKLPLFLSTLLVVLLLLVPFVVLVATVIPSFSHDVPALIKALEKILQNTSFIPPSVRNFDFAQYAQSAGTYLLRSSSVVTGVFTSAITLIFLTFYLIYDAERLMELLISVFPKTRQKKIASLLSDLGKVNGQYIRGNLLISLICGVSMFIGLTLLGVPFAAPLAIFVALFDLLPLIGSTIGMIPAVIIGLSISPLTAILVAALYITYQQIESALLAPAIYNKALKVSASLGFIAVIIGAQLYGVVGAFLALPVVASLPTVISFIKETRNNR